MAANFFILTLNPDSQHSWDQVTLRDPLTCAVPDLAKLVASALNKQSGKFLVSVKVEVAIAAECPELPAPASVV